MMVKKITTKNGTVFQDGNPIVEFSQKQVKTTKPLNVIKIQSKPKSNKNNTNQNGDD